MNAPLTTGTQRPTVPMPDPNSTASVTLSVRGLSKTYKSQSGTLSRAVHEVDLDIRRGQFVSFVGPSGCGKTTLMNMLAGLTSASEGDITYEGVSGPVPPGRAGIVFQTPALLPWRTIEQNIQLPAEVLKTKGTGVKERVRELLELVQLEGVANKYPGELSGGMQQRASICRALLHEPEILFMDEPFGALDAMTREELNMQLQRIHMHQGKTVVFITHSIQEAVLLSDRVVVMSASPGRVVADREVHLDRPRDMSTTALPEFIAMEAEFRSRLEANKGKS